MLEVSPDAFDGVHLWGMGRQALEHNAATLRLHMGAHALAGVGLQAVPDDQQFLADRRLKGLEKFDDLRAPDRAVGQAKVEASIADPGNHRQLLPAEAVPHQRRFTLRSPGSRATRSLEQSRLVYKDDYSALSRSDFLSAGHFLAFQVRIAASSRSRAWPRGRCTLQPSRPRKGHHRGRGKIPGNVQSSVANPAASGPAFSIRASSSRCDSDSRSGRPKCSARRSASSPPCWRSLSHRITVWRETPTFRASSVCGCPAASSFAPPRRRRSNSLRFSECCTNTPNVTIPRTWPARSEKSVTQLRISQ